MKTSNAEEVGTDAGVGEMPVRDGMRAGRGRSVGNGAFAGQPGAVAGEGAGEMPAQVKPKGALPDYRVTQPEIDQQTGKTIFRDVGALWRNVSKNGNVFYTMKVGKLRLLVFPNNKN